MPFLSRFIPKIESGRQFVFFAVFLKVPFTQERKFSVAVMKPFHIFLVYDSVRLARNRWFAETLTEKCSWRGWKLEVKLIEELRDWFPELIVRESGGTGRPDAVFMRCTAPEFSRRCEDAGLRVFNSARVSEITNDKLKTFRYFQPRGIPMMESWKMDLGHLPAFPCVLKSRDGHGGSEVFCVHEASELRKILQLQQPLETENGVSERWMVQRLADAPGRDLRIYVVGNEIIAAMERRSESDFRSNYSLGGTAFRRQLTDEELELAGRILKMMKFDFAGIDLIFHEGRPILNEIEDVVGSRMLYAHTELDILEVFLDHAERELNS